MSRIASISSAAGPSKAGSPESLSLNAPHSNGSPWPMGRTVSGMSVVDKALDPTKPGDLDPHELLTTYSVSDVRKVQQRLRTNAEAKREELRLMVGERYRDLLQASSSIISMAASSKRVLQALEEMHDVVKTARPPRTTRRSRVGEEDSHIQALQSLSAHLKLLLDAPEHLWRFMEQRLYLKAAWLFLTARVVHRTLLQEDEDAGQSWHEYGIDVSEQIPLVQRQWDLVSQFRSQITHKANLSLRESSASSGEICATLLTLHILESRPLAETLSIFLTQRSKTLTSALSRPKELANGHAKTLPSDHGKTTARARKPILREVKRNLQIALEAISHTLRSARDIFSDTVPGEVGIMQRALQYIQDEKAQGTLPPELQMTTRTLLNSLPSSAHFSLLPDTIRSYKPYIGATYSSPSVTQTLLQQKLGEWFTRSLETIQAAATKWLASLETVKEVWDIRASSFTIIAKLRGLDPHEQARIRAIVDTLCQQQTVSVWQAALSNAASSFQERLTSAVQALKSISEESRSDAQPVDYLFHPLPLPSTSQVVVNLAGAPFKRYQAGLHRQLRGRTPLLDGVLDVLEESSSRLEGDLAAMHASDPEGLVLVAHLREAYQPEAVNLCSRICSILHPSEDDVGDIDSARRTLAFLGRLQYELASSSSFISTIGVEQKALDELRTQLLALHDQTFERWRGLVVENITTYIWPRMRSEGEPRLRQAGDNQKRPSTAVVEALLHLASSLQDFWAAIDPTRKKKLVSESIIHLVSRVDATEITEPTRAVQYYWDVRFVRQLLDAWDLADTQTQLDGQLANLREKLRSLGVDRPQVEGDDSIPDYLSRMQVIFAPLFPPPEVQVTTSANDKATKSTVLLCYAPPAAEQHFQPALDLVKPSARFGLLLLGSSNTR
ncbi:hypothetical protein C8Q72DRAFT_807315 [Fomitopsis betulina]|nr:hypothetical protein C8Q72DRAFT_807315 [Fomitopsis betulina]